VLLARQWLLAALLAALLPGAVRATASAPTMAVTIDDLPFVHINSFDEQRLTRQTARMLTALNDAGIEAVGFVNEQQLYQQGKLDESRVALLRQWLDAGMELGNHTYSHLSLNTAGADAFTTDILHGEQISRELTRQQGRPLRYFRHPFLHVGSTLQERRKVERFLEEHGYTVAPVTIVSEEWHYAAAYNNALAAGDEEARARIGREYLSHMLQAITHAESLARQMFGRNIPQVLLLHASMLNADHLPALIGAIRGRGYRFVSLDEVLRHKAYRSRDTYTAPNGDSWLDHWLLSAGLRPPPSPAIPDFIRQWSGARGYRSD
jgi:peptidoglycan/xylan/chitin deacetylase (PgdA/CDA1 family)